MFLSDIAIWARDSGQPVEPYAYGVHPEQVTDLRLPPSAGLHPVAVLDDLELIDPRTDARAEIAAHLDLDASAYAARGVAG